MMPITSSYTSLTLLIVTLSVTSDICEGGLKNQRNFAHVYGKRAFEEAYDDRHVGKNIEKFPMFQREFPVDYIPSNDDIFLRRDEPKVKTKANVAHMFGRELYDYDSYPVYSDLDVYNEPELQDDEMVELPTKSDDARIELPDGYVKTNKQRERFPLRDLLRASPAARLQALSYLNNIVRRKRGTV